MVFASSILRRSVQNKIRLGQNNTTLGFLRNMSSSLNSPVEAAITAKLTDALEPSVLQIINESHMHNV